MQREDFVGVFTAMGPRPVTVRTLDPPLHEFLPHTKEEQAAVAKELGVDALIEGSVLRAGDKVRITAQLILGATDEHVWANSYDRDVQDVLGALSEVSRSIAREVQARLGGQVASASMPPAGPSSASGPPPRRVDPVALDAVLRARQALNNGLISSGGSVRYLTQSVVEAQKLFQQATTLDPQYADAWSGLAFTTLSQGFFGTRPAQETSPIARDAAGKALEIDPMQGEAYGTLGFLDLFFDWKFDRAKREFEKAISLDPYHVHIRHGYADYLIATGRARESVEQLRIAREHNPNSPWAHLLVLTHLQMASRDWDEVIAEARRVQAAFPTVPMPTGIIADCLWRQGKYEESLRETRTVDAEGAALKKDGPRAALKALADNALAHVTPRTRPIGIASLFADIGDRDTAFAWLEKAFAVRQPQLLYVPARVEFDGMRDDPRYIDLMRRIGLPITK
jgi:tetratricopeptide (TPR) repeat protein